MNLILIGQAEVIDLLQPQVRKMLESDGIYIGGDTKQPELTVPLAVQGGKVFSMVLDSELDPERFLSTLTLQGPYRADKPPVTDALTARAFQIADEAMEELLCSHTSPVDPFDSFLRGLSDERAHAVKSLAEADPAIIEAFEWLSARGLAELVSSPHGECILLKVTT